MKERIKAGLSVIKPALEAVVKLEARHRSDARDAGG